MTYALPFASGIALALANIALTWRLAPGKAAEFYNLLMAATAAVYIGSALAPGNTNTLALETALSAVLFSLALVGTVALTQVHCSGIFGTRLMGPAARDNGIGSKC